MFGLSNSVNWLHFWQWSVIYQWKARIFTLSKLYSGHICTTGQCEAPPGVKNSRHKANFFSPLLSKSRGPSHFLYGDLGLYVWQGNTFLRFGLNIGLHVQKAYTSLDTSCHNAHYAPNSFVDYSCTLSRATSLGAPSYGGMRTWVEGSQKHALQWCMAQFNHVTNLFSV